MRAIVPRMTSAVRLAAIATEGEAGRYWYDGARRELAAVADHYDQKHVDVITVAAIISPRTSVRRNMKLVGMWCRGEEWPDDVYGQKRRAVYHYLETGEVSGQKVIAFRDALCGFEDAVVLDTWMATAMLPPGHIFRSRGSHPVVVEARDRIHAAAALLQWKPAEVQAAVWSATYTKHRGTVPPTLTASDAIGEPNVGHED